MAPKATRKGNKSSVKEQDTVILVRKPTDVLCGRGNGISAWPGNIYFRQVVNQYRLEYKNNPRNHKGQVALSVIAEIEHVGGRFLTEAENGRHFLLSKRKVFDKTVQALREHQVARPPTHNPFPFKVTPLRPFRKINHGELMNTIFGDGSNQEKGVLGKLFSAGKRLLTGESLFMTVFTNEFHDKRKVSFASPYPGSIVPINLAG